MTPFPKPDQELAPRPERRVYHLTLAYDGTDYFGWQVQPGLPTIQGVLSDTLAQITGERVLPQGSGRTDTGVHAEGQAVSLDLAANIPADRLLRALNRRLPAAIRVVTLLDAPQDFHARANVVSKTYEYRIFERRSAGQTERPCPPTLARFVWDCRWPLQIEPMERAASALVGTHDYTSFAATDPDRTARRSAEDSIRSNVRSIFRAEWKRTSDGLLRLEITGSGFLHHMVRNIVGTCVDAGAGRLDPASIPAILAARDRSCAGATAPAGGLHLIRVLYRDARMATHADAVAEPEAGCP